MNPTYTLHAKNADGFLQKGNGADIMLVGQHLFKSSQSLLRDSYRRDSYRRFLMCLHLYDDCPRCSSLASG